MTAIEFFLLLALSGSMIINFVSVMLYGKAVKRTMQMIYDHANEVARLKFLLSLNGEDNDVN